VWLAQWGGFLFVTGTLITLLSSYALGLVAPLTNEELEQQPLAAGREPVAPEHARRWRTVRQPAARRERPHAQPRKGSPRHRS
jgi:hypothetical protein